MDSVRSDICIKAGYNKGLSMRSSQVAGEEVSGVSDSFSFGENAPIDNINPAQIKNTDVKDSSTIISSMKSLGLGTAGILSSVASTTSPVVTSLAGSIVKMLIDDEAEEMIGQAMAKEIESTMPISKDPALNARVQNLGEKIAANSSRPNLNWSFKVVDDDEVNAFAGPGGKIYVNKGLLEAMPEDDHLAFILGHEVGHVEHRDSIDRIGVQFALGIAAAVLSKTPGKLDDAVGLALGMLYDGRVSQSAEYKADKAGARHMHKLGFDPERGAGALRGLLEEGARKPGLLERLFSSHPPTERRAQRVEEYGRKLKK